MMDTSQNRWDDRSGEQWLDDARRFEKMIERFSDHDHLRASFSALARDALVRAKDGHHTAARVVHARDWCLQALLGLSKPSSADADYLRRRVREELTSAGEATDIRVARVHLELAERYLARIPLTEGSRGERLACVS